MSVKLSCALTARSSLAEQLLDLREVRLARLRSPGAEAEAGSGRGRRRRRGETCVLRGALGGVPEREPPPFFCLLPRLLEAPGFPPSEPIPDRGHPPRATVFIIFAAWSNRCTSWLTSVTVIPDRVRYAGDATR
jgi:hypothetical protein